MAQSFNVFSTQFAKFAAPGRNSGLGDFVLSRDVTDRRQPRFAQNFYDLTFRKIYFLHGYRKGWLAVGRRLEKPKCTDAGAVTLRQL